MNRSGLATAIGDYLAGSYKFPLGAGLGAGAAAMYAVIEFFPGFMKAYDPGLGMLIVLGVPLVTVAAVLVVWQRRWRAMRATEHGAAPAATKPVAPPRGKFSGLPDPGASQPAPAVLPAAAMAALDQNDPIGAIKVLRAERGLGLAEAKAIVDSELVRRKPGKE